MRIIIEKRGEDLHLSLRDDLRVKPVEITLTPPMADYLVQLIQTARNVDAFRLTLEA